MIRWSRLLGGVLVLVLLLGGAYKLHKSTTVQAFGGLTARVETSRRMVALTFDDGPTCQDAEAVLAATSGVRTTFYVNGTPGQGCPEVLPRLVAAGHEIGNHTWDHRRMIGVTPGQVAAQIEPTDALIRRAGFAGEITVRPPYGNKLLVFPGWLAAHHRRTITWDVSVERWDASAADQRAADIARETVAAARPGSIVLLHPWNGRTETQRAIPLVVQGLRDQSYELVTVTELLRG